MNRFLINCAWDIMDLGKANHVDNGVARDMFVENLSTFGTDAFPNYPGADVDYAAYLVEGEGAAFTLLTVCSTQAEDYALRLREVVDTFALTPQLEAA